VRLILLVTVRSLILEIEEGIKSCTVRDVVDKETQAISSVRELKLKLNTNYLLLRRFSCRSSPSQMARLGGNFCLRVHHKELTHDDLLV